MRGSPFFEGVRQVELEYAGASSRMPIFYYEGRSMTALFPARLKALRDALPDPRFSPARLAPGVGVVGVTAFEYADTDIGAYNELAISIILNEPPFLANAPGRALGRALRRRQFHAYIHHLPVTTEIARMGGKDFYGYPKFVAAIEFSEGPDHLTCRLAEGAAHILTLTGTKIRTRPGDQIQFFSHLWMDRQPQTSEFKISAMELGMSSRPASAGIEVDREHPIGAELRRMLLLARPFHYQYTPRFEGILYGPDHLSFPLLERVHDASARLVAM